MKKLPKPSHYKVRGKITQSTHVLPFDWKEAVPHYTIDECKQMFKLTGLTPIKENNYHGIECANGEYCIYVHGEMQEAYIDLLETAYHDGKLNIKAIRKAIGEQFKQPRWELFD